MFLHYSWGCLGWTHRKFSFTEGDIPLGETTAGGASPSLGLTSINPTSPQPSQPSTGNSSAASGHWPKASQGSHCFPSGPPPRRPCRGLEGAGTPGGSGRPCTEHPRAPSPGAGPSSGPRPLRWRPGRVPPVPARWQQRPRRHGQPGAQGRLGSGGKARLQVV